MPSESDGLYIKKEQVFYSARPLNFCPSSVQYPMSSVERPKKRGQKSSFFAPIPACFSLKNHNILWFVSSISACHHKTSSLSPPQHGSRGQEVRQMPSLVYGNISTDFFLFVGTCPHYFMFPNISRFRLTKKS